MAYTLELVNERNFEQQRRDLSLGNLISSSSCVSPPHDDQEREPETKYTYSLSWNSVRTAQEVGWVMQVAQNVDLNRKIDDVGVWDIVTRSSGSACDKVDVIFISYRRRILTFRISSG